MTEPIRTRSNAPSLSIPSTSTPLPTSQEPLPIDAPPSQLEDQPKSAPPTADVVAAAKMTPEESKVESQESAPIKLDIEHLKVDDDPRLWSNARKSSVLAIVAFTAMGGTITASIFFPALDDLQRDLNASTNTLALTVSLFILGQGFFPQIWTAISEVSGRKYCYLSALVIYLVTTAVAARATSIGVFIGMRIGQALGSSAVLALGAGSLADIYDTHERGTKLGIFYSVPLVGPALGPILGGALTSASDWRSTFYFLLGYGALCFVLMWLMPNTFRKERSYAWRKAMERSRQHTRVNRAKAKAALPQSNEAEIDGGKERDVRTRFQEGERGSAIVGGTFETIKRIRSGTIKSADVDVKLHLRDINPFAATLSIIVVPSNLLVLIYSGLLFAAQYTISYTAARTFAAPPYNYSALIVGCVLLSFGFGNVVGSVVGGRWSDAMLKRMKEKNGGRGEPEMRIRSTYAAMVLLPPLFVAYAWLVEYKVHIAAPVVVLFFLGMDIMIIYASTLAYVVDGNPGKSTSAVATNSIFRGVLACISSQVSESILDRRGNGAFYTGWAILLALGQAALVLVSLKGKGWREKAIEREEQKDERQRLRREERLRVVTEGR